MSGRASLSRRAALAAPAMLMTTATACAEQPGRRLVAYVSRSGNTRVIAGQLQRELPADLFEILPRSPYPADYEQTVAQAERERRADFLPPLKATIPDLSTYQAVWLGFPIWGQTIPPLVRSFLQSHDLAGKTVQPFITHGGYGPGDSMAVLKRHAGKADILDPFVMQADQERRTMTEVRSWMASAPARQKRSQP